MSFAFGVILFSINNYPVACASGKTFVIAVVSEETFLKFITGRADAITVLRFGV
jgi:hypothetical protein